MPKRKPKKTITKKSKDGKVIQTVNVYTGKRSAGKQSVKPVRQPSTTELLLSSLLQQSNMEKYPKPTVDIRNYVPPSDTSIYTPPNYILSSLPKKSLFSTTETQTDSYKIPESKKPITLSEDTSDAFTNQKNGRQLTRSERRKIRKEYYKQIKPDTETEVEGFSPTFGYKLPSYAFQKETPITTMDARKETPITTIDAREETPITTIDAREETPITTIDAREEEIPSLIPVKTPQEVIYTGEKKQIKKPKLTPNIEDFTEAQTGRSLPLEQTIKPKRKKALSQMNKSELQDKYREVFKEEPNKSFSKKDLYEILK